MHTARWLLALGLATVVVPATARADTPWEPAQPVGGVSDVSALLSTEADGRILVGGSTERSLASPTVVARLGADGVVNGRQTLPIAYAQAARFLRAGVLVAGSRPASTSAGAAKAPVLVAVGSIRGTHGIGKPQALPGSRGDLVIAVGGNPESGVVALVTASFYPAGPPHRVLWVRRGRTFRPELRLPSRASRVDAAVAVGSRGDVLVAFREHGSVFARHLGRTGHAGPVHRLGPHVQGRMQARVADDGRLEVAWLSQRVAEGFAGTPAFVAYVTAAPRHGFGKARILGRAPLTGNGVYVQAPGVRLVAAGPTTSSLAWTDYADGHFRVRVAEVEHGHVRAPQTVSSPGGDDVLGDLAATPTGARLVLWLTQTRGGSGTGLQRVAGAVRHPGAQSFGPPELVSPAPTGPGYVAANAVSVPYAPVAAIGERDGRPIAAWTTLTGGALAAGRPAG